MNRSDLSVDNRNGNPIPHTVENEEALKTFITRILDLAKQGGATAAEVAAQDDVGLDVKVREADLETVEFCNNRGFEISVYVDQSRGHASTTDMDERSVNEAVQTALAFAKHTASDPCSGLADADRLASEVPDLDLYHPEELDVSDAQAVAEEMEAAAMEFDPRMYKSDGARVGAVSACSAYGNSLGFLQSFRATSYNRMMGVLAKDENGMQSAYWYTSARIRDDLDSAQFVGATAASRAVQKLAPRSLATGSYPVLFDCSVAPGLISHLMSALSGRSQYLKSSYLLDSLGQTATTRHLTLKEYPQLARAVGSRAFDAEGVATYDKAFIDAGVVSNYVLNSYSGRKLNIPTTGNASGVNNLTVEADFEPLANILRKMGRGLVVNSLMGQGVNILTGDYSRGASGYWVENGEFAYAVDEVTIAGKLDDMLKNIVAFGDDIEKRRNIRTGSILVESMTVAAH